MLRSCAMTAYSLKVVFSLCLRYEYLQTRQGLVQVSGTSHASKTQLRLIGTWPDRCKTL